MKQTRRAIYVFPLRVNFMVPMKQMQRSQSLPASYGQINTDEASTKELSISTSDGQINTDEAIKKKLKYDPVSQAII
jgi:hypothetical protein